MKRLLLTGILGLTLLVQGAAAAASPHAMAGKAGSAGSVQTEMPCHHSKAPAQSGGCCQQDCSDMSGCAFGHLAAIAPAVRLQFAPARQSLATAPDSSVESVALPSRLRPPIVSPL